MQLNFLQPQTSESAVPEKLKYLRKLYRSLGISLTLIVGVGSMVTLSAKAQDATPEAFPQTTSNTAAETVPLEPSTPPLESSQETTPLNPAQPLPSSAPRNPSISPSEDVYRLGGSDEISISIFEMPENFFDRDRFIIPIDGYLNLPWVGQVYLDGLTIPEAEAVIAARYSQYIRNPLVTVSLISPRSLRVAVAGQVERPGSYSLTPREQGVSSGLVEVGGNPNDWPTVVEAIQAAGGLQQQADLRNVEVRRVERDGSERVIDLDLWALLKGEGRDQDISLRDRDTVFIPTAPDLDLAEAQQIAIANFSPDNIGVNVAGEVKTPGLVTVEPNASLNQAILAAGGFTDARAQTADVNLIRLNANGTVTNRVIPVDYSDPLNDETNPALQDNDIVVVSRSGLAESTDFLDLLGSFVNAIVNPINGVFDLFDNFGGNNNNNN